MEVLISIREEMAREADFDTDLFGEIVNSGRRPRKTESHSLAEGSSNGTARHEAAASQKRKLGRSGTKT
ncbi:MAG: hypothetical protein AB7Q37_00310 [Pyrinomonadaceae bacterium]